MKCHFSFRCLAAWMFLLFFTSGCSVAAPKAVEVPISAPTVLTAQPAEVTAPVPTETVVETEKPFAKGFVVFDSQASEFHRYNLDGSLAFKSPAPGIKYPSAYNTRPVDGAVYFLTDDTRQLFRSSPDGVEQVNIPTQNLSTYAVSPDEKQIAWSTLDGQKGISLLWIANLDGSGARQVARYTASQSDAFSFSPIEWTADGKLLFDRTMTGMGGYILFGGRNSLYSLDPTTNELVTIVPAEEKHGLCLDSYRLDLDRIAFNCTANGVGVTLRSLKDQSEKTLPLLAGQGLAGSIRYSPSGKWLAYATAAGDPDNESGQVVVVPADLSAAPEVIAKVDGGSYAYVQGWLDENTLLFSQYHQNTGRLWTIHADGSGQKQIAEGPFLGWVR